MTDDRDRQAVVDQVAKLLAETPPTDVDETTFWAAQYDHGLAWVGFPEGLGGMGVSPALQADVDDALRAAGAPSNELRNPLGVGMAAPTILAHGTDEQRRAFLRPIFTCEDIWCQLFSEPGAGSDLAGLACRAVRAPGDGDADGDWVVNGHKLWVTLAHVARWGLLLARTDPDVPKHQGLTYFILDMAQPGVDVRPLRQITGGAEFNEVVLTDVRVPDQNRLGDVGDGWRVAMATLLHERVSIGKLVTARRGSAIESAIRLWQALPEGERDPARRDRLMELWVESEVVRLANVRAHQQARTGVPGPEGSVAKLAFGETSQRIYDFCLTLMGPDGMLIDGYEMVRPEQAGPQGTDVRKAFLRSRGYSIEGGTSEVMRNILAERVLGLPPEPRQDKDRPWSEVPRNSGGGGQ